MTGRDVRQADVEDVRSPLWEEAVAAGAARGPLVLASDVDDEAPGSDDADGNLRRYARWQWRDFWRRRGGWLALGALLGVSLLVVLAHYAPDSFRNGGEVALADIPARVAAEVRGMAQLFFTLGGAAAALLGVGGLVSRERERGLQRFLFAKPVPAVRYYLQALALNTLGAAIVFVAAVLLAAAVLGSVVPVGTVLATGLAAYVLTAGTTFFMSTLIRFDAPVAAAWLLAGFPVMAAAEGGIPGARLLSWLFPQGPALALAQWAAGNAAHTFTPQTVLLATALVVLLGVGYGLLAVAGGVAVLRRRAIST